ncbi:hypothetical protein GCM10027448_25060 [Nocardioides dilutus]
MTRVVTVLFLSISVALSGLVLASPASAVVSTIDYTLDGADPTMTTPLGGDSTAPCVDDATAGTYSYEVVRFKPTVTGSYTISEGAASPDGRIGIYTAAFAPTDKLASCLAFIDDNTSSPFSVGLTAGVTYTMVRSSGVSGGSGSYQFDVDGPGVLTVLTSTATTLTTTPNPSELSKATTLKAVVAGGATPNGTVEFRDGATLLGSVPLAGGVAQLAVSSMAVGNHTLSAAYLGDDTHDVSTGIALHKVQYGPKPKVKLSVSDKTPYVGQKIKLTWVTTGADEVKASGNWKGSRAKKGSKRIRIKTLGFHVFKLKATNVNGSDRAKVKVIAQRAPKKFTVTVPDEFLTVNSKVRVKADGLDAKERFKVFLDDELLGKGFADKRGDASALVLIPKGVKEGDHTLTVMGSNKSRVGSVDVVVLAPKELEVELRKKVIKSDGTQTVTVTGLLEGERVTLTYDGEELVEAKADQDGEFKYTFPVGSDPGTKTVEVVGGIPGRAGEATFEVDSGPGPDL